MVLLTSGEISPARAGSERPVRKATSMVVLLEFLLTTGSILSLLADLQMGDRINVNTY